MPVASVIEAIAVNRGFDASGRETYFTDMG